jgi:hypothetical protein
MTPTLPSANPVAPAERPYLSAPRVPSDVAPLPPARNAVTDDACPECSNLGRVVEGVYGGKVVYVSGCPECGREEEP